MRRIIMKNMPDRDTICFFVKTWGVGIGIFLLLYISAKIG
jgi:hypothetical protein